MWIFLCLIFLIRYFLFIISKMAVTTANVGLKVSTFNLVLVFCIDLLKSTRQLVDLFGDLTNIKISFEILSILQTYAYTNLTFLYFLWNQQLAALIDASSRFSPYFLSEPTSLSSSQKMPNKQTSCHISTTENFWTKVAFFLPHSRMNWKILSSIFGKTYLTSFW